MDVSGVGGADKGGQYHTRATCMARLARFVAPTDTVVASTDVCIASATRLSMTPLCLVRLIRSLARGLG